MASITVFGKRAVCLAAVAMFLFVTAAVGAESKYAADRTWGGNFAAFDRLNDADSYGRLAESGGAGAVGMYKAAADLSYVISKNNGIFQASVAGGGLIEKSQTFSEVLEKVRIDADGKACNIQLGNSDDYLDIGSETLVINGAVVKKVKWGEIRLSGWFKNKSGGASDRPQSIIVSGGASVVSSVDIDTDKDIAVQVEDSSKFTYAGTSSSYCGNILNTGTRGSTVKVVGGLVEYIDNEKTGRLEVVGGQVGFGSRYSYAIKNDKKATTVISGDATVVSGDTTYTGGTILNYGNLEISGGSIKNERSGNHRNLSRAIYSNVDSSGIVTITGNAKISSMNDDYAKGMLSISGGKTIISGGEIGTDDTFAGGIIEAYKTKLIISDSARIKSVSTNEQCRVIMCNLGLGDSLKSSLSIIGGKIEANEGVAVQTVGQGRVEISENAMISSNSSTNAVVSIGCNGYLYIYDGTIESKKAKNDSKAVAIFMDQGCRGGHSAALEMGGDPIVDGLILMKTRSNLPIHIKADGRNKFNPIENNIYRIATLELELESNDVVVENGAVFSNNFVLETTGSKKHWLAINGDDVVTAAAVCKVSFSLNGPLEGQLPPPDIWVMTGGTIGTSVKPLTKGYISKDGYKNDGNWYVRDWKSGNNETIDYQFRFNEDGRGTVVEKDIVLMLDWTNERVISVLESFRDLPASRYSESAAIAPIAASSGSLTAGPTPVSRSAGAVSFFRSGASLKNSKLFIYDASGNFVSTLSVNDPSGGTVRRLVASWNLQDAKGRPAAEGTYVARGVITTKAGKTENVSVLINVQR